MTTYTLKDFPLIELNPILTVDSYKTSHPFQYPDGSTNVSSYIESRGGPFNEAVFFGLQAFIIKYLLKPITKAEVDFAADVFEAHGTPFDKAGWMIVVDDWDGFLPIEIEAVPEGTVMPTRNAQVQIINLDDRLPWMTSAVETAALRAVWYASTVATLSRAAKQHIYKALKLTSDDPDGQIDFKLHDFGARGATSSESAMLGGMGHLVNFKGTDTVEAVIGARMFYGEHMAGFSIPATEHSTITSWGRSGEVDAYRNFLLKNPTGLIACVSDSYDMMYCAEHIWGGTLKEMVESRDGTLVVRPDSGDPMVVPLDVIEVLMTKFGYTVNSKGFKVLPDCIRVLQGDGMNIDSIQVLLTNAIKRGISIDNFAMGMGGGLLQKVDRDTMKYAMKASAIKIDGIWNDVFKDPITDKDKRSKKGRLSVIKTNGNYATVRKESDGGRNIMRPVLNAGKLLVFDNFDIIRERAAKNK
ncbi:MAG: nicotinate phosphoribosyltransferase [Robiginitomaculum sp.]|nr:MAG: nicotinate phosphoribosyltransferase [Robiginitomaculum sp.]